MSLLTEVADRIRALHADLPLAQAYRAGERLRMAGDRLGYVLDTARGDPATAGLAASLAHLERATTALCRARDELDRYLAGIGTAGAGAGAGAGGVPSAVPVPATEPVPETPADGTPGWWLARVGRLTRQPGAVPGGTGDRVADSAYLLHATVTRALAGQRTRLYRGLAAAEPVAGLGLTALVPPVVDRLATELLGHRPAPGDLPALRTATRSHLRVLLPGLEPAAVEQLLARYCRVRVAGAAPHPVDRAVAGAVVVAGLLYALRRTPAEVEPPAPAPRAPVPATPPGQPSRRGDRRSAAARA